MKTSLKIWMIAFIGVLLMGTTAFADNDKPITVSSLPAPAKQVLNRNFANKKVALAQVEGSVINKSYDVVFTNGDKVEFDKKGNWTEIDCKRSSVPSALVPSAIKTYVQRNYAGNRIVKIERDSREYDVKLSNGIELTFNKKFQLTDIDN